MDSCGSLTIDNPGFSFAILENQEGRKKKKKLACGMDRVEKEEKCSSCSGASLCSLFKVSELCC